MIEDSRPLMVSIRCVAYNQARYIRQCLEGFVMQQTNFRFEAIVHDDASTDGTDDIIREYAEKYPDIIKPIFETENQYSKKDGSLRKIMDEHCHGKYVAICEGDDYWTDPLKLQKQVDFMESHPNLSQCFTAHSCLYPDGHIVEEHRYDVDNDCCPIKDAILMGGGFMASPSVMYKNILRDNLPGWYNNLPVGDLPKMLVLYERGDCGYINDVTVVYRVSASSSWTNSMKASHSKKMELYSSINRMWKEYDEWTNKKNHKWVRVKRLRNTISKYHDILKHILNK